MRRKARVLGASCLLLASVAVQNALAQQPALPVAEEAKAQAMTEIQLTRTAIAAQRQAIITQGMDLTVEEMQRFWPLYREYRLEAAAVGDRIVALLMHYAENGPDLTDEVADAFLAEFVSIEKELLDLKARYLPKFKNVLPARKVARFYQLENKLDIFVFADLAQQIPLAR
jgi:hypothetical protein